MRGIDNACLLPAVSGRSALLHGFHRLRQHAEHAASARPAAHHGQPALLGAGDARRRLPLRSGQHLGPRTVRGGQAGRVLRHHPPGSDSVAGQADRRAVGRRRGRLSGRQFPRAVDRMERQIPRLRPPILERRRRHRVRIRHAPERQQRSLRMETAAVRTPASISSPATTASRCRTSSATTTSTTRPTARQQRDGANDNNSWNCGAEGPTDDPAIKALRERQKRNFIATLLLSQGVPMICGGDELSHTQNGNNNAYCQDNELTWLNWELDDEPTGVSRVRPQRHRASGGATRSFNAAQFFQGRAIRGSDIKDISWFKPSGEEMRDERLERRLHQMPGRASGRRSDRRRETNAASRSSATRCCCCSTPITKPIPFTLPARGRSITGSGCWTPRPRRRVETVDRRRQILVCTADRSPCCERCCAKNRDTDQFPRPR